MSGDSDQSKARFHLGQPVKTSGGDYEFEGHIVAVFRKRSGKIRYVVEDGRGFLMIQMDRRLEALPPGQKPTAPPSLASDDETDRGIEGQLQLAVLLSERDRFIEAAGLWTAFVDHIIAALPQPVSAADEQIIRDFYQPPSVAFPPEPPRRDDDPVPVDEPEPVAGPEPQSAKPDRRRRVWTEAEREVARQRALEIHAARRRRGEKKPPAPAQAKAAPAPVRTSEPWPIVSAAVRERISIAKMPPATLSQQRQQQTQLKSGKRVHSAPANPPNGGRGVPATAPPLTVGSAPAADHSKLTLDDAAKERAEERLARRDKYVPRRKLVTKRIERREKRK